jgi:tetratricopeptide (TPR) repeat protein
MFDFGKHLHSAGLKEHGKALELFTGLAGKASLGKSATDRAKVHRAEIFVKYFGKYDEALKTLGRQGADGSSRNETSRRAVLARARAMLGLGRATEAADLVRKLAESSDVAGSVKRQIKHSGMVRHARLLAETRDDPNQLDHAAAMIEMIIAEDPAKVFAPNVNLVALDIHLARKEFEPALYLADRLGHLQLNDYDRAEILTRHVVASCGMKDLERARSGYARLSKDYPYIPAVSQAKKAIMETFGRQ